MKRRMRPLAAVGVAAAAVVAVVLGVGSGSRAAVDARWIYGIQSPSRAAIEQLAARADVDVRWVESGLVLCEVVDPGAMAGVADATLLVRREGTAELALLRGAQLREWRKPGHSESPAGKFVAGSHVASARAAAGEVWLLLAPAGSWPEELRGCHGALIVPAHGVDPRSVIDAGPPPALAGYLARPPAVFDAEARAALAAVSADTLRAYEDLLTLDPVLHPSDRYVFNDDLEGLYNVRALATMQRLVAGISGATVRRQRFRAEQGTRADSTSNLIARLPGSVPGTGLFVISAHIDAIGSRDATWQADVAAGRPVQTPGGEDNASGVACVLELLRAVAEARRAGSLDLAFDLEFVAFSAEEIGLQGSDFFVQQAASAGIPLLGNYNLDMVGYQRPPQNLQLAYNPASHWLVELLQEAQPLVVPPSALQLTPELDETRASDHNSFWMENGPAILLADATIDSLRSYTTYHTPNDLGSLVDTAKMAEVTRLLLAGLLRFDTGVHALPELTLQPEDFRLYRTVQGEEAEYIASFHRLWPGVSFKAETLVRNLGAPFVGTLRLQYETRGAAGVRAVVDSVASTTIATGGRFLLRQAVPILPEDRGWLEITAVVTATDSVGRGWTATARDSFVVTEQAGLDVTLTPNPVRGDPGQATLRLELNRQGTLQVEIYTLEGERVGGSVRDVVPRVTTASYSLPLFEGSGAPTDLASGTYLVNVQWRGDGDERAGAQRPLVIIR